MLQLRPSNIVRIEVGIIIIVCKHSILEEIIQTFWVTLSIYMSVLSDQLIEIKWQNPKTTPF